jgi:hydroxymethylpyrimidine pyrophosphatase-like HAD family hydrolase
MTTTSGTLMPDTGEVAVTRPPRSSRPAAEALIASDIDGTLLVTGQPPSSAVVEMIAAVRRVGHCVVLTTGRSLSGGLAAARELGVTDGRIIASNGAVIAELTGGSYRLIEVHGLDAKAVVRMVTGIRPDLRIAVEIVGTGYRVNMRFPAGELNGEQVTVIRPGDLWAEPTPRVALFGDDAGPLVPALRAAGFTAIATRPDWVDITVRNVSKATAAERVRQDLGIPIERTVAIGDAENDIELLQWAWRGVAMGHADIRVREAADEVTGSVGQEGAVRVLRSLLTPGAATGADMQGTATKRGMG